jgi:copper chaperone CopZ
MRDNRCRERVALLIGSIAGVHEVDVNLFHARATVVHDPGCDVENLVRTIADAGYDAAIAAGE